MLNALCVPLVNLHTTAKLQPRSASLLSSSTHEAVSFVSHHALFHKVLSRSHFSKHSYLFHLLPVSCHQSLLFPTSPLCLLLSHLFVTLPSPLPVAPNMPWLVEGLLSNVASVCNTRTCIRFACLTRHQSDVCLTRTWPCPALQFKRGGPVWCCTLTCSCRLPVGHLSLLSDPFVFRCHGWWRVSWASARPRWQRHGITPWCWRRRGMSTPSASTASTSWASTLPQRPPSCPSM